ncbi:MAG: NAD-dependent epimerase/dehydratase family protein, partial [Bradymonadia bacterium]
MSQLNTKPTVVVAGASGFVGQAIGATLSQAYTLIGLSRSTRTPRNGYQSFRKTDLFSLKDCEAALEGADVAIYLVHSMMPSARLVQGNFSDLDLLCADNFARAAKRNGVRQIVYLGGLLPATGDLSLHLKSRAEVERALAGTGVPVTTLRAGLVVGHDGSSFQMLLRLVERLPVMLCPAWTSTRMQPVAIRDVVAAIQRVTNQDVHFNATYDLGCPEVVTYRELLEQTAEALGLERLFISVPLFSPNLSRLWVSLTTGAPKDLVGPLVKSLTHEMIARDEYLFDCIEPTPLKTMLEHAVMEAKRHRSTPRAFQKAPASTYTHTVRSVQRMTIPEGTDAEWATEQYIQWLPVGLKGLVRVRREANDIHFTLFQRGPTLLSLSLRNHRSEP